MQKTGRITVRGIVQGVGFRPFVYAQACDLGIAGSVKNLGSEVEIFARGDRFEEFVGAVSRGPPLSRIDSVEVTGTIREIPDGFFILPSGTGSHTGMIPPDIALCNECIADIFQAGGRYENYWATSCVNCGPGTASSAGSPMTGSGPPWRSSRCARLARGNIATRTPGATMPRRSRAPPAARSSPCMTNSGTEWKVPTR